MKAARRSFIFGMTAYSALALIRASAQRRKKVPRVALVLAIPPVAEMAGPEPANRFARAFIEALRDIGLVDGNNIVVLRRSAEGRPERLSSLMQEMVALDVDAIVTSAPGVSVAQNITDRIAIIGLIDGASDAGLVSSLARPGRNLTGFGLDAAGLSGKLLQLLKESAPAISRVAVIAPRQPSGPRASWRLAIDSAARSMHLDVSWAAVDAPEEFDSAFSTIVRDRTNALLVANTALNSAHLRRIADFTLKQRLPSACTWREFAEAGGLLAYGSDELDGFRHAAVYVKKILEGAKPGDLPFEQPTKFELVINMKTANALGLAIPQSLLSLAQVI